MASCRVWLGWWNGQLAGMTSSGPGPAGEGSYLIRPTLARLCLLLKVVLGSGARPGGLPAFEALLIELEGLEGLVRCSGDGLGTPCGVGCGWLVTPILQGHVVPQLAR